MLTKCNYCPMNFKIQHLYLASSISWEGRINKWHGHSVIDNVKTGTQLTTLYMPQ